MDNKMYDLLIIGQGLAGINISFSAYKQNLSTFHIHNSLPGESTKVAAGLINPITGRRFTKSWMIEEVMPFAEERYRELGNFLDNTYYSRLNIVRRLNSYEDENTWLAKSADPYLQQFLLEKIAWDNKGAHAQRINIPEITGELKDCFRIHLTDLQQDYIDHLQKANSIKIEIFDHNQLQHQEEFVEYKGIKARKAIFCEGWKSIENPFFQSIPLAPAKGELLLIHSPKLQMDRAFKQDIFITPLENDLYWVGATYEWQNYDPLPSDKMKARLLNSLNQMIKVPYEIIQHLSGIRPASKDRKPILGPHPTLKNLILFNGMGTKGSSLAPLFSKILIESLTNPEIIPQEVNINRYY